MDPTERPIITVMVTRVEDHTRVWRDIDLMAWPHYQNCGWAFVGIDPETEAAWQAWRDQHPEAV